MIRTILIAVCFISISGCSMHKCGCADKGSSCDGAKASSCSGEHKDCGSGSCGK